VWAFRAFLSCHFVRCASAASMLFMLTEAALGAGIVLLEYVADDASAGRAGWMALHLANTFVLVASLSLTAWYGTAIPATEARRLDAGGGLGAWIGVGAVALLLTGVAGAVTALGDTLFPASSLAAGLADDASPTAHFLVRLRVIHPVIATVTFLYLAMASALVAMQRPAPRVRRAALVLVTAMTVQMAAGLLNLALLAPISMQLVHLLLADVAWIALVLLGAIAMASPRAGAAREPAIAEIA
jgi:heme A synthase